MQGAIQDMKTIRKRNGFYFCDYWSKGICQKKVNGIKVEYHSERAMKVDDNKI